MRAFTAADVVQDPAEGTSAGTSTATVTVPNGTTEGNTGVIAIYGGGVVDKPEQWDTAVTDPIGSLLALMFRADLPPGESSWDFGSAGVGNWAWKANEWSNIAWKGAEGASAATQTVPGEATLSTGNASFTSQYVLGLAAFTITSDGTGTAWSSVTYDPADPDGVGGFVETDVASVGTGTGAGDVRLLVARRYGQSGDTSPWNCTITYGGSMTGKTLRAALVVLGAWE